MSAIESQLLLSPLPPLAYGDDIEYGAHLEIPGVLKEKLWYRVPAQYADFTDPDSCDAFVLGSIFLAMEQGANIIVSGRVSPSLIANLSEFQNAWNCWLPKLYAKVEIEAELEQETPCLPDRAKSEMAAFTGGLDSSFTMFRHMLFIKDRQKRDIKAGLLVHGFDIPLSAGDAFARVAARSREVLASVGVPLISVSTNVRQLGSARNADAGWNYTHGAALASVMLLLQRGFSTGIIPATYHVSQLLLPWGSNPITDRFLGTANFKVVHDAAHWLRFGKLQAVSNWPEAYNNLRVCFHKPYDENCCRCLKCIMTLLQIQCAGLPLPTSFRHYALERDILALEIPPHEQRGLEGLAKLIRTSGVSASLAGALQRSVNKNRRRFGRMQSLSVLKSKLSGTPLFSAYKHLQDR